MPYTSEDIIEPFWAENANEASGRDPLAIQNSSVVIYTKMIVGINNVTNRIRYNGFYCWIFDTIAKNISKNNSLVEQIRFSRRAELLLAYIMVKNFPDVTGISGSAFAAKNINNQMKLNEGADWEFKKEGGQGLYWKFKLGVFGQYYSGVVRDLNLINHPQDDLNIYTLTTNGQDLASAFAQNIPNTELDLFWQSIHSGTISEDDLLNLTSFALHIIPQNSKEHLCYQNMLLLQDDRKQESTYHRRNTLTLILRYLSLNEEPVENLASEFLRHNYLEHYNLKNIIHDTATAWYLFEINELVHVVFEHFHACFLYSIDTDPISLEVCLEELLVRVENEFTKEDIDIKNTTLSELSSAIIISDSGVYTYYDAMEQAFKNWNLEDVYSGECLTNAIKTILVVYHNCKEQLEQLKAYACLPENNFNRSGYAIELFEDLIESKWNLSIYDYIKSVLLQAINRHTFSSYSKTKIGQNLVHNYMIEDNNVWRLRETFPNRTSPRLQNVIQYLIDIGWLTKEGRAFSITDLGTQILIANEK